MNKVYLVYKDNGMEYEDYEEWVEYATSTFDKAEQLIINDGYTKDDEMKNIYFLEDMYGEKVYAWIAEMDLK